MLQLSKDQARKLVRNKLKMCDYCKSVFKTDAELLDHLKERHGKFEIDKPTKRNYTKKVDTFDPEKVFEFWKKYNKSKRKKVNPYSKGAIRDLVNISKMKTPHQYEDSDLDIYINIAYIWDKEKEEYRIYTISEDTVFGKFVEIIEDSDGKHRFRSYQTLKKEYKKKKEMTNLGDKL